MKTLKYIFVILAFLSCKKEETEKETKQINTYTLSVKITGYSYGVVRLNGNIETPPFEVSTGDVVTVDYRNQGTSGTVKTFNILILQDSKVIGECSTCTRYINTFYIQ